jgi:hypothetical protein
LRINVRPAIRISDKKKLFIIDFIITAKLPPETDLQAWFDAAHQVIRDEFLAQTTEGDFAAEFKTEPFEAIHTLRVFVEFGLVTKVNATKWLFPLLLKARGDLREHIYEALLHWEEPDAIRSVALAEYDKYGNEERLALAASLLADIGAPALPVLRVLARSDSPECEMFVPVMASLHGVSMQSRLALLAHVASNACLTSVIAFLRRCAHLLPMRLFRCCARYPVIKTKT